MGRSGKLYTYQKMGVVPDILTTAKALGCGFPIGAMLTTKKIASSLVVGTHGSTFGGNPMACAVACKVLELINTSEMLNGVEERSQRLIRGINQINSRCGVFQEVRGVGLLLGCELKKQYAGKARDVITAATESGLLVLVAGADVVRLAPPLNISEEDLAQGLERFEQSLQAALSL